MQYSCLCNKEKHKLILSEFKIGRLTRLIMAYVVKSSRNDVVGHFIRVDSVKLRSTDEMPAWSTSRHFRDVRSIPDPWRGAIYGRELAL